MKDVGQGMSHNMSKGENLPQSQPGCSLQYPTIVADGLDHAGALHDAERHPLPDMVCLFII